jgi:hypothetical protein
MTTTEAFGIQDVLLALLRSRRDGARRGALAAASRITEAREDGNDLAGWELLVEQARACVATIKWARGRRETERRN